MQIVREVSMRVLSKNPEFLESTNAIMDCEGGLASQESKGGFHFNYFRTWNLEM